MIGLVLCGGRSTRMGTDKGLMITSKKVTWAQHCFSLLAKLDLPVVISVNQEQQRHYSRLFPFHELIVDDTEMDIGGPLLGLLTVHQKYPGKDILVLACDMVEMNLTVLQHLRHFHDQDKNKHTCFFADNEMMEPLCAIYSKKDLAHITRLYHKGALQKHSLKYCLQLLDTRILEIPDEWKDYFKNFNTLMSI